MKPNTPICSTVAPRRSAKAILSTSIAALALGVAFTTNIHAQNLVTNGDFSANAADFTSWPGYFGQGGNPAVPTGWNVVSNNVLSGINGTLTGLGSSPFAPPNNVPSFLFLQNGDAVTQAIATTAGHIYGFAFSAASGPGASAGLSVFADNTAAPSFVIGNGTLNPSQFANYSFAFTGTGGQTIQFSHTGSSSADVTNVSVRDVSGLWKGGVSGALGGGDLNFAADNLNFADAAALAGTLHFGDADGLGGSVVNTTLTVVAGGVTAGTLAFDSSAHDYTLTSSDATGVTDATALAKSGASTLTIAGTHTYTGGTELSGGTLVLQNAAGLGDSALTLGDGTVFRIEHTGTNTNAIHLTGSNQTISVATGTRTYTGAITTDGSAGTLAFEGGMQFQALSNVTFSGNALALGAKSLSVLGVTELKVTLDRFALSTTTGDVNIGNGTLELTGTLANPTTLTIGGGIRSAGGFGSFTMNPDTSVTVSGGVDVTSNVPFFSNASLHLNGGTLTTPFIVGQDGSFGARVIFNGTTVVASADSADFLQVRYNNQGPHSGSAFIEADGAIFDTDGHAITIANALSGGPLTKQGLGTLTFSEDNYNSGGATIVKGGTLKVQRTFYTTGTTIHHGAVLELNIANNIPATFYGGSFSGEGTPGASTLRKTGLGAANLEANGNPIAFALDSGSLIDVQEGSLNFIGVARDWTINNANLFVAAGATFHGGDTNVRVNALDGTGTIESSISNGSITFGVDNGSGDFGGVLASGRYLKEGTGTQTLSNVNTYTDGTTVNDGMLNLTAQSGGAGTIRGTVTVNTDGELRATANGANDAIFGTGAGVKIDTLHIVGGLVNTVGGNNRLWDATINMTGGELRVNGGVSSSTGNYYDLGGSGPGSSALNTLPSPNTATISGRIGFRSGYYPSFNVGDGPALTDLLVSASIGSAPGFESSEVGVIKDGAGTLALTGLNTYGGSTFLGEGVVNVATFADYGDPSSLGNRSLLRDQQDPGNIGLTFYNGTLQYTGNTAQSTNRAISVYQNATLDASGSQPSASLGFTAASSPRFSTAPGGRLTLTGTHTGDNTFAMAIEEYAVGPNNSALNVVKNGPGKWLLTSPDSNYKGVTILNEGVLNVASFADYGQNSSLGNRVEDFAFGADNMGIHFRGGTLQYTGTAPQSTNRAIQVGASGLGSATIDASGANHVNPLLSATLKFTAASSPRFWDGNGPLILTGTNTGDNTFALAIPYDQGSPKTIIKNGPGAWLLSGNSDYSGDTFIEDGTLVAMTLRNTSSPSSVGAAGKIFLGHTAPETTGTLRYVGTGAITNRPIDLAGATGGGVLDQSGTGLLKFTGLFTSSGEENKTLTLQGSTAGTGEIESSIQDNSPVNKTSLNKSGAGTWALSGPSTYTGATNLTGGTLVLSGAGAINSSSGITINGSGAKLLQLSSTAITPTVTLTQGTLDGTGTVSTVNVGAGTGGIIANGNGTPGGVLTIGALTFSGTAMVNLLSDTIAAPLVTTSLSAAAGTITINASNTSWNAGTYDLIAYGGGSIGGAGFDAFTKGTITGLVARQIATLGDSGSAITLGITSDTLLWTGIVSGAWTTDVIAPTPEGYKNWRLQSAFTPTDFLTGDIVRFSDPLPAAGTNFVEITTDHVRPMSTTFDNSHLDYTLSSPNGFGIATGSLTKSGSRFLILNTVNTYTGGTTLTAGTLLAGNSDALGLGTVTMNGGTLQTSVAGLDFMNGFGATASGTFDVSNSFTISGPFVSNTAGIQTVTGAGTLTLSNLANSIGFASGGDAGFFVTGGASLNVTGASTLDAGGVQNAGYLVIGDHLGNGTVTVPANGSLSVLGTTHSLATSSIIGQNGNATGTLNVDGGTVAFGPNAGLILGNNQPTAVGIINVNAGLLTVTNGTVTSGQHQTHIISLGRDHATATGIVNLNGGTFATGRQFVRDGDAVPGAGIARFNFNGGILKALGAQPDWLRSTNVGPYLALTSTTVKLGGAKVDTNGFNVGINNVLAHDAGLGSALDGGLFKSGSGMLTLGGVVSTYTGTTTFAGGIVNAAAFADYDQDSSLGNRAAGADTAADVGLLFQGGTLQYTGTTPQMTNRAVAFSRISGGTIDASGANEDIINNIPSATLRFTAASSPSFWTDPVPFFGGTINFIGTNTGPNTFALAIPWNGNFSRAIFKDGPGTWVLSGNNSYLKETWVNAGTLRLAHSNALGTPGINTSDWTIVLDGGALELQSDSMGNGITVPEHFHFNGVGPTGKGGLRSIVGHNTLTSAFALDSDSTIGVDADSLTVAATGLIYQDTPVPGQRVRFALTKIGDGTLNLNSVVAIDTLNTEAGHTNINNVLLNSDGVIGATLNANAETCISVSQTLAAVNIGPDATVTLGQCPPTSAAPDADAFGDSFAMPLRDATTAVPEPSSLLLLLAGAFRFAARRRRAA